MKRILALFITAAMLSVTAAAEEFETSIAATDAGTIANETPTEELTSTPAANEPAQYKTLFDLFQAWHGSAESGECPYPDYVCGVWTDTGYMDVLTVATTKDEAGLAGQEEILSLIENDDSVKFTFASHPAYELWAVQEEISAEMGGDSPIVSCGIDEMNNCVSVGVLHDDPNADATAKRLLEKYLDKVVVDLDISTKGNVDSVGGYDIGGALPTTGAEEIGAEYQAHTLMKHPDYTLLWVAAAALCVAIIAVSAVFVARRRRVLRTSAGSTSEGGSLSSKQVADAIKENPPQPNDAIFEKISHKLEEKQ